MALVPTTTAGPPGATEAADSYLDPNVVLSLSIIAMAMHTLAEFLGADVMGYATLQIGIAVATRACATGSMQSTFDLAAHVLSPARHWNDESSEVPIAGPAVVFLASLVAHYLIAALCGLCTYACCREPGDEGGSGDDDDDDAAGEREDGDGRPPPNPYGGGCWKLGSRMMRWPFWSVTLVRLNIVPCTVFALLQLGRGNQAPEGSEKEEVSQGVAASGAVLSTAVMIVLIGAIIVTHRFVERMRPKWIYYGGSGNPDRRDIGMLPCNGLLIADGFWSDHGNGHIAGAAVAGAARGQGNVIVCCVMAPIVVLITAAFVGGPWELVHGKDSDTCVTPFAVPFGLLILCGLMPVVLLRPYRHAGTNLMTALRLLALCMLLLSRIVPDDAVPQDAFTGIFFGTEVVTSFVTMVTGLIERLLWRPAEAEVRTVRLRYLMIVGRVMRAIDLRFGAGTPEAEAAKRAVPNMPLRDLRAGQYLDAQAIADVDMVEWREGDAPNEVAAPQHPAGQRQGEAPEGAVQLARRNSAMLTVPVPAAAGGDNAGATRAASATTAAVAGGNNNPLDSHTSHSPSASPPRGLGGSSSPPPIVFSPSSPHPIPRREMEEAGSPNAAAADRSLSAQRGQQTSPLPGGANPEAESLFLEMDILTAAISRFPSEPAPATAALIRDPFSVSASPRGDAGEGEGALGTTTSDSVSPLRPTRSVRFGNDATGNPDEAIAGSSSILDPSMYPATSNGSGDETKATANQAGAGGARPPPITFMQPQSRGGSLRVSRPDQDDDPDL